eukprot:5112472-Pyramimonas_sp.AAC.1
MIAERTRSSLTREVCRLRAVSEPPRASQIRLRLRRSRSRLGIAEEKNIIQKKSKNKKNPEN